MTAVSSVKRRYLALWFPFLPTDRLRLEQAGGGWSPAGRLPETPQVLVARVKGAQRLGAVNAAAQASGLAPGMALADARAIYPDLAVAGMDEAADRHWLMRLAEHCRIWSPRVTLVAPDGITLDTTGGEHLFQGEQGLAAQVEDALSEMGVALRQAMASTPAGAQALARHGSHHGTDEYRALRALPVVALGLDGEATLALRRAGLKTIGDLASRSSSSIAARFGAEAVSALRHLLGEEHAPIDSLAHPEPLHFERCFAEPVAFQASIAACFLDLLREGAGKLEEQGLGGRRFVLMLFRSDGARHRLAIETGLPTRDPAPIMRLFEERIAALADPLDPGFGYDRITLFVSVTEPLAASQPALDGKGQEEEALIALIDRLSTRLGPQTLCRLVPRDSHIPEQAQLALPAVHALEPVRWPDPPAGEPPIRPLFLFDPPQPVDVVAEVPDGPPHRFLWRRKLHEVRLYEGPERIAAEWWRRKGGEHPGQGGLTRDYYRIEDVRGRRYWIFRHGLYDEKRDPKWYVHGLFA